MGLLTCGAPSRKYKRYVDAVFRGRDTRKNVSKLTEYAVTNHHKLPKIGKYFYLKTVSESRSKHYNRLHGAIEGLNKLVTACAAELHLFDTYVVKTLEVLLVQPDIDLRVLATESFIVFANHQDDATSRKLTKFVDPIGKLCLDNSTNETSRLRLRKAGMKALIKMVHVVDISDINLVSSLLPPVLTNMRYGRREGDGDGDSVQSLAEHCLKDIAMVSNAATTADLLNPLFRYLDDNELWVPNTFAVSVMKIIATQSQHSYLLLSQLQRHFDEVRSIATKTSVITLIAAVFQTTHRHIGPTAMVALNVLLKQLLLSVKDTNPKHAKDNDELREAAIQTIGSLAERAQTTAQVSDLMSYIMSHVPDQDAASQNVLLQCAIKVAEVPYALKHIPSRLCEPLLVMTVADNARTRALVMGVFTALVSSQRSSREFSKSPASEPTILIDHKHMTALHYGILQHALNASNEPANIKSIFDLLKALFETCQRQAVVVTLPMLAYVQEHASDSRTLSVEQTLSIHTLVGAYFNALSKTTGSRALESYIQEIIDKRRKNNQMCVCLRMLDEDLKVEVDRYSDATGPKVKGEVPPFNIGKIADLVVKSEWFGRAAVTPTDADFKQICHKPFNPPEELKNMVAGNMSNLKIELGDLQVSVSDEEDDENMSDDDMQPRELDREVGSSGELAPGMSFEKIVSVAAGRNDENDRKFSSILGLIPPTASDHRSEPHNTVASEADGAAQVPVDGVESAPISPTSTLTIKFPTQYTAYKAVEGVPVGDGPVADRYFSSWKHDSDDSSSESGSESSESDEHYPSNAPQQTQRKKKSRRRRIKEKGVKAGVGIKKALKRFKVKVPPAILG